MRKPIKPFFLDGEFLDDSQAIYAKVNAEKTINHMMRDKGYLKVLDLDPFWIVRYDEQSNKWYFDMTIYGVYMGKKKAWQFEGISQGKLIPRNTPLLTLKR
jgi:hypothetical protein